MHNTDHTYTSPPYCGSSDSKNPRGTTIAMYNKGAPIKVPHITDE